MSQSSQQRESDLIQAAAVIAGGLVTLHYQSTQLENAWDRVAREAVELAERIVAKVAAGGDYK